MTLEVLPKTTQQEISHNTFVLTSEVKKHLENWVRERPITKPKEMLARKVIVDAIEGDDKEQRDTLDEKEIVKSQLTAVNRYLDKGKINKKDFEREDSMMHELYKVRLQRDKDGTVTISEIGKNEKPISLAEIKPDGTTRVILHYEDSHYTEKNANLDIDAENLPKTAMTIFDLLAKSVL